MSWMSSYSRSRELWQVSIDIGTRNFENKCQVYIIGPRIFTNEKYITEE
jgi:hypothetical protein